MNLINRMLIILQLAIAIVLMPILIVLILFYRTGIADAVSGTARNLATSPNIFVPAICIGLAALVFIIAILLLVLEMQRPSLGLLKLAQVTDGHAEITADAITHRLEHNLGQIADVSKVRLSLAGVKKTGEVDVAANVETTPEVNVPEKTQEVIAMTKRVMEEQVGLKVGKIQVRIDHSKRSKKS